MVDDKPKTGAGMAGDRSSAAPRRAATSVPSVPTPSLPKGGGAVHGIGEKLSTNLATGTASLSIPVATSPGRSGFDLDLGLSYDSGAGNGPFGIGWRLSAPAITRKTDQGLPRYLDGEESDVFVLSGAEDLVPVPASETIFRNGHRIRRYRPRVEGLFARIERWTNEDTGIVHFRVITRDNVTNIYGKSASARIADPAMPSRVFSWLLEEARDDRGNVVRYTYKPEDGAGVDPTKASEANRFERTPGGELRFIATAQRYLKRIQYGNRVPLGEDDPAPAAPSAWLFEVVFDYGEHDQATPTPDDQANPWLLRSDPLSSHRAGFEVRTYRLCRRVLMFHRFAQLGSTPCLVRSTDFTYDESPALTYLTRVEQVGYARKQGTASSYTRAALPPLALDYTRLTELHDTVQALDRASFEGLPDGVSAGAGTQWVDLDGEGIPGVLRAGERGWFYKANLGEGKLAPPALLRSLPIPAELAGGFQQLVDIEGDGRLELLRYSQPLAGYFTRTADGDWEPFTPLRSIPNIDWNDANLRTIDLDGDGYPDVLITEQNAFVWYRSLAEAGFEPARRVSKALDEDKGPTVVFADGTESIHLADMSGDGLVDIVRVRNGEVCYWPNLGHGRFGSKVTMDRSPRFDRPDLFDPKRIRFADVDGSGTTDILYLGRDGVAIFLNQSGNGLSDRRMIRSLPLVDPLAETTVVDLRGRGTTCLVWSSPAPESASRPLAYIDLMGGVKPHLLVSIKNNLGAETRIDYAPSTKFYLADKAAGTPWITRLPFPVHVVERVTTIDRISRNRFVTRYAYHHGYFDGKEREFRGFGRVDQWDTEELGALAESGDISPQTPPADNMDAASHVPPVLTKTWFHTGAFFERGRISRQFEREYYREPGLTDEQLGAMWLPDAVLPAVLSADDAREACRALKASILRREVYAVDGTEAEGRPYVVSERNYTIAVVQPRGEGEYGVFFVHPREAIEFHYERKLYEVGGKELADPRVTHELTLDVDAYGNVRRSVAVGYGRRHDSQDPVLAAADRKQQRDLRITFTDNAYTNAVEQDDAYRAPRPCESRTYEITKLLPSSTLLDVTNLFGFDEMAAAIAGLEDGSHDLPYEDVAGAGATQSHPYRRLLEHMRTLYRRDDLSGPLPLGKLEPRALAYESLMLALTPAFVAAVYGGRVTGDMLATDGGYVHSEGDSNWWIPSGRVFYSPGKDDTAAGELAYAKEHFFLPCRFLDPFGQITTVTYDPYDLLVWQARDPIGNLVTVGAHDATGALVDNGNDYRVLQPARVMDPNRNRRAVAFDALGMVVGTAVMGKPEERLGDSLDGFDADLPDNVIATHLGDPLADPHAILQRATTRLVYDLFAYLRTEADPRPQCPVVYTLARETHDADLSPGQKTRILHSLSYSDGFGRELQKKIQAEAGPLVQGGSIVDPRWVGSGWTIFNNKGQPVRRYEPFFSDTHRFESAKIHGVSSVLFYDPIERVVATLHTVHTYEKVVFDPWHQVSWDVNDTVLQSDPRVDPDAGDFFRRLPDDEYLPTWYERRRTGALGADEKAAADKAAMHAGTPAVAYFDALGRPFLMVAHNRYRQRDGAVVEEKHTTRMVLDIEGNQREVIDARDRVVMRYDYDMMGNRVHLAGIDAGERWTLNDVTGKPIHAWNSRGHAFRTEYDEMRRPVRSFARGADPEDPDRELLYEKTEYGEGQPNDIALNLRGRALRSYDGAGVVTNMGNDPATGRDEAYDFKGNLLRTSRQLAADYKRTVDWSAPAPALEAESFATSTRYDALDRAVELTTPDKSRILPSYNEANLLERIRANLRGAPEVTTFVESIDYDAKGQRTSIGYGNGATTDYTYDPQTYRLVRLVTTRNGGADVLQDLGYTFDPVGNITHIRDGAQQTIYFANAAVEPVWEYAYDAIYRLIEAAGREHLGQAGGLPAPTTDTDASRVGLAHPNDRNAMGLYRERYGYDAVGNLLEMAHRGTNPANPGWTRSYAYSEPSLLEAGKTNNRLSSTAAGDDTTLAYAYDAHGNMVSMPHLPVMRWDYRDRLQATSRQVVQNGGTPETTYYVYDSTGKRVRKVTERQAGPGQTATRRKERVYLGGFEVYREYDGDGSTVTLERETVEVSDDNRRVALVETNTHGDDGSATQILRYQIGDHLGSASLELDGSPQAKIISYEEHYPYGGTSYQAVRSQTEAPKRYRYTGKERDEESGLYYHGARYYAPWLGRWTACDPALLEGVYPSVRVDQAYVYVENRPIIANDPDGAAINFLAGAIGAGVGLLVGGGIEAGRQLISEGRITSLRRVGAAAAGGALSGGLAGVTLGASLAVQATAATTAAVVGGATTRAIAGERQTAGAVATDAAIGLVTFGLVRGGSAVIQSFRGAATRQATQQAEQQILQQTGGQAGQQTARQTTQQATQQATGQATQGATQQATRQTGQSATQQATRQGGHRATQQATRQTSQGTAQQATRQAGQGTTQQATRQAGQEAAEQANAAELGAAARLRAACPTADCDRLSRALISELQRGELVTLFPVGRGPLPTLPGVAPQPWAYHTAVRLPNGSIVDPLLQRTFSSLDAFRRAIVGETRITTMINGSVQR